MILNAIDKKQTFNELIGQANAMVTSVLNDPLKRSFNVLPSQANFGPVKAGGTYEMSLSCKNEDMLTHRLVVRGPSDKRVRCRQKEGGPVAPGMIRNILVQIRADTDKDEEKISEVIQIISKTDIYKIPVTVHILNPDKFEEIDQEAYKMYNKSAMKTYVQERIPSRQMSVRTML